MVQNGHIETKVCPLGDCAANFAHADYAQCAVTHICSVMRFGEHFFPFAVFYKTVEFGHAPRPGIGIKALDETLAAGIDAPGVIVADVVPGSPADLVGLEGLDRQRGQLGDVITHVDGNRVRTVNQLAEALAKIGIGNEATLTVARGNVERKVRVEIVDIG